MMKKHSLGLGWYICVYSVLEKMSRKEWCRVCIDVYKVLSALEDNVQFDFTDDSITASLIENLLRVIIQKIDDEEDKYEIIIKKLALHGQPNEIEIVTPLLCSLANMCQVLKSCLQQPHLIPPLSPVAQDNMRHMHRRLTECLQLVWRMKTERFGSTAVYLDQVDGYLNDCVHRMNRLMYT